MKEIKKTIVDKKERLKEKKYEIYFKKMKDELVIFKEKARKVEKMMMAMNMKIERKLNTVEDMLTTKSKVLDESQKHYESKRR